MGEPVKHYTTVIERGKALCTITDLKHLCDTSMAHHPGTSAVYESDLLSIEMNVCLFINLLWCPNIFARGLLEIF